MGIGVAKAGGKEVVGGAIGPGEGLGAMGYSPGVLHRKTKVDLR